MSGIEFNDQTNLDRNSSQLRRVANTDPSQNGMIGWLVKKGIAKDENIGQFILIGIIIFFFAMSALMFVIL